MATVRLKHVNAFCDRHGRLRHYLRLPGRKSISLPGLPGSPEFMSAYSAALDGVTPETRQAHGAGTVSATILAYLRSAAFHDLAKDFQRSRRSCLEQFAAEHGDKRIALLEPKHVRALIEAKRETPGSAHALMSSLSVLMAFAVDTGLRQDNPTLGIKRPKLRGEGFKTWSEADIAQFENRHPVGSRARLALALLLYTGQRRGDVIRMGPQHVNNGAIELRQQKTKTCLAIPIHPALAESMSATPSNHLAFLVTEKGKPFTAGYFTRWFRIVCKEAGIADGLSAHGLRKATARRLAESGCTAHQIAAITGHKTLREVERYTKAASQVSMARQAMQAMNGK